MMTLYDFPISGNCHKVRMLLSFLGIPHTKHPVDLGSGEQRGEAFRALNPFGQVPVLNDDGEVVRDSHAILVYLAAQYGGREWWTQDPARLARIAAWLSTAANEIAHGPANLRAHHKFGRTIDVDLSTQICTKVLTIIDSHLADEVWLVGESPTIADIAIFPYLALASEGKVDMNPYPNILAWFTRIGSLPHYIDMPGMSHSST